MRPRRWPRSRLPPLRASACGTRTACSRVPVRLLAGSALEVDQRGAGPTPQEPEAEGELDPRFAAIPIFAVGTGLRPEEWVALERRDIDRRAGVVTVERVYTQGRLKPCAKTSRQRRRGRYGSASSTLWMSFRRAWTPRFSSPAFVAATSSSASGAHGSGHRRFALPASPTAGSTTSGTRTQRRASRPAFRFSRSRVGWERRSR